MGIIINKKQMNQVILDLLTALLWQLIVPGVVLIIA